MILALAMVASCLPVAGDQVTAGDLAAAVPALRNVAPATQLGYAPAPGARRIFQPADITRIIARLRVEGTAPEEPVCVERKVATLERTAVVAAMRRALNDEKARIEIVELSHFPTPEGEIDFPITGLSAPPVGDPQAAGYWKGSIRYGAAKSWSIWARVKISVATTRVVAAEDLKAGVALTAAQLRTETCEGFPDARRLSGDAASYVGWMPRRQLRAGTVLDTALVEAPKDVEKGERVMVTVAQSGVVLRMEMIASASGRRGEMVLVKNPSSGKQFAARVEGKGLVSR